MKIYALANELNLDRSNAGTITIPFGTWDYGEKKVESKGGGGERTLFFRQTLDLQGASAIAAQIADSIAKGEKGVPVYWGHPDVPELAHKYPDKRAKGWITSASVEDGKLVLSVDWLEDKATDGFGWFSPFWTGPVKENGDGTALMHVESLTSVALINMPNIKEFRLANEAQPEERETMKPYQLPQRIIDLANEYDESKHPRAEDGKWTSGGSAAALSAAQAEFDTAKSELIAGQKRGWSKAENDRAFRRYDRAEKKLKEAKDHDKMIRASSGPGRTKQPSNIKDSDMIPHPVLKQQETKKKLDALWAELGRRFDDRMAARLKGR